MSLVFLFFLFFLSIQLINFICFQEQGRRNDLYSKCVSPVPQDLMSTPGISKNIKSDSVHCDPLSCVASGSRCHTADYLNVTKGVDASIPCLMYSHSKPPPPGSMCSPSPVQTPLSAHSVHLLLLLMLIVQLYFIAVFAVHERSVVNRIISFEKW